MICLYEDEKVSNFGPLVDLRAVFELRCGMRTLIEKIRRLYPKERMVLWVRKEIAEVVAERYPNLKVNVPVEGQTLFISARAILLERLALRGEECLFVSGGRIAGARLKSPIEYSEFPMINSAFKGLLEKEVKAKVVQFPWELIEYNPEELKREIGESKKGQILTRGAKVWKGAFISTESGPVFIDQKSEVRPGSFVEGPCYIGPHTIVDGALVRPGCSFGPHCRIGGEVQKSIFQGYSNKHHEGFIGHSFVGEWVNLGALTTSSDLKNNYKTVKVTIGGKKFDTGMLHLGCFIGDHAKMGIGTLLPTGAVIGTFANWFEGGFAPKELAPFSWGREEKWRQGEMVECARRMMRRRGVEMSQDYERLLLRLYQNVVGEAKPGR
ncbi:MAG: putative sugar nucleotidyl transferase [candidate division WOR-3 bacterium]